MPVWSYLFFQEFPLLPSFPDDYDCVLREQYARENVFSPDEDMPYHDHGSQIPHSVTHQSHTDQVPLFLRG